ncbi:hypothetical protein [Ammoniphilus sp. 3BR4]|uniref:hypothetical protein n=1 Tax=Ammoniphilus sp. 3BR4 TaxID=3158265 RepID=UPI0034679CAE
MSKWKIQSTKPSLPSDLEELLEKFESETRIHEFAKDLVRGHYEEQWEEAV